MTTQNARRSQRNAALLACLAGSVLLSLVGPSAAHANSIQMHGRRVEFVVHRSSGAFDTALHENILTAIDYPGAITMVAGEFEPWIWAEVDQDNDKRLLLKPHGRIDRVLNIQVEAAGGILTSLKVVGAGKPQEAIELAEVITATEKETRDFELQRQLLVDRFRLEAKYTLRELLLWTREKVLDGRSEERWMDKMVDDEMDMLTADVDQEYIEVKTVGEARLRIRDVQGLRAGRHGFYVSFWAENRGATDYKLADLKLFDEAKDKNHASLVRARSPVETPPGMLAVIPPGKPVKVVVKVADITQMSGETMSLMLTEPGGLRPVAAAIRQWEIVPVKPPYKPSVSLHVQGLAGGIWLANPLDDKQLDPTGVMGLGLRVGYELSKQLGVEIDAVGATSGEAQFNDVDWNGTQGDLLRRATLGRVSFGGILRLSRGGSRYVPVLRLGLGLQGASHTAEMEVDKVRMPGPDVGFELNPLWFFGAGIDARLGSYFTAGVALSVEQLVGSSSRSLEVGVHLGYSWKP